MNTTTTYYVTGRYMGSTTTGNSCPDLGSAKERYAGLKDDVFDVTVTKQTVTTEDITDEVKEACK
jgi:hypothetical protein